MKERCIHRVNAQAAIATHRRCRHTHASSSHHVSHIPESGRSRMREPTCGRDEPAPVAVACEAPPAPPPLTPPCRTREPYSHGCQGRK